jgi:hypothetical protein
VSEEVDACFVLLPLLVLREAFAHFARRNTRFTETEYMMGSTHDDDDWEREQKLKEQLD